MSFHDVRFPTSVSFGAIGGPQRRTEIVTLSNGYEERNTPWAHARRRYDAGLGMRSLTDLEAVIAFFEARQGQLYGFRWKDWTDYKSAVADAEPAADDQPLGDGDGATTAFSLSKRYVSGGVRYTRPIAKPVPGSVLVSRDGAALELGLDYTVDHATGSVTLTEAPEAGSILRAGFAFDVPVRFDTDRLDVSASGFEAGEIPSVPVIEIRV